MKVFFDTNVYVAEAILGQTAERLIEATQKASWRICVNDYVLDEVHRVLTTKLGFSKRFAVLTQSRIIRRSTLVAAGTAQHPVPNDSADTPILSAAINAGVDYLVTNDAHLLGLDPYRGLRIISMNGYLLLLAQEGLFMTGNLI
jgi:putative PIN family toxin of toxin-antitoxin system